MNSDDPSTKPKMSFKQRMLALVSVLWVIVVFVVSLNFNSHQISRYSPNERLDVLGFFNGFVIFGIIPLILLFGIKWVAAARRHRG